jgi:hypothetical protein
VAVKVAVSAGVGGGGEEEERRGCCSGDEVEWWLTARFSFFFLWFSLVFSRMWGGVAFV